MFQRTLKLPKNNSFFLIGPRGSGKSTYIREHLISPQSLTIDLLEHATELRYSRDPDQLIADVKASKNLDWVIIDEVQKIPKLLDIVHKLIEEKNIKFALTGSSSRKLKREGANLLAGRAFIFHMHPLTAEELGSQFHLSDALSWGTLPKLFSLESEIDKKHFLNSYIRSYLKEEVLQEQLVRNVDGFRGFLEIAAQMNGKNLNFSKIARETQVDSKTVKEYFQILEDTLLGFWLPGFHQSLRKAQKFQPKFYFFDTGVRRALEGSLDSKPIPGTSLYGQYFEHFILTEVFRLNSYCQKDFHLSHFQTSSGEIDLILSKGMNRIAVEIKSSKSIDPVEVRAFSRIAKAFKDSPKFFVSQDPQASEIDDVRCLHFIDFFKEIFNLH